MSKHYPPRYPPYPPHGTGHRFHICTTCPEPRNLVYRDRGGFTGAELLLVLVLLIMAVVLGLKARFER